MQADTPFVGQVFIDAFNFSTTGFAACDGSLLPIAQNETLFNLIGTTYGGDGQSMFALPDLQGRVPLHQGAGFVIGQLGGVETVTLTTCRVIPSHTHAPGGAGAQGRKPEIASPGRCSPARAIPPMPRWWQVRQWR